jgi:hypothetical protein
MRIFFFFQALLLITLLFLHSCSKKTNPVIESGADSVAVRLESMVARQERWFSLYDSLLAVLTVPSSARDSLVKLLARDTSVSSVYQFTSGINVVCKDGQGGSLLLQPHRTFADSTDTFSVRVGSLPKRTKDGLVIPDGKKTLLFCALPDEFAFADNMIQTAGNQSFPSVDFEEFEFKSTGCGPAALANLDGGNYSFIRLSSHGVAWPSDTAIREVYFVTGETVNRTTSVLFSGEIQGNSIRTITTKKNNRKITYYEVNADFFTSHNNFGDSKPFVQLGFCYSGMGGWPQKLIGTSKAGGCTGYDWSIRTDMDIVWSNDFITAMCDTTRAFPCFGKRWMSEITPSFFDETINRTVSIAYYGEDSLAFWSPFKLYAVIPGMGRPADTLTLYGKNFGDTVGSVLFDYTPIDQVLSWSDTLITVVVPQDIADGTTVGIRVSAHGDTTNEVFFTLSALTYNYAEFKVKVYASHSCAGTCASTCDDDYDEFWAWGPGTLQGNTFVCPAAEGAGAGETDRFVVSFNPVDSMITSATYYRHSDDGSISLHQECTVANLPLSSFDAYTMSGGFNEAAATPYVTQLSQTSSAGGCTTTLTSHTFAKPTCGVMIKMYYQAK